MRTFERANSPIFSVSFSSSDRVSCQFLRAQTGHVFAAPRHPEQVAEHAAPAMITREAVQSLEVRGACQPLQQAHKSLFDTASQHIAELELTASSCE